MKPPPRTLVFQSEQGKSEVVAKYRETDLSGVHLSVPDGTQDTFAKASANLSKGSKSRTLESGYGASKTIVEGSTPMEHWVVEDMRLCNTHTSDR